MFNSLTKPNIYSRWLLQKDLESVLAIEESTFEFAWTEEDFARCLRQRNCMGMVAELNREVVGFMIFKLHSRLLHLLNLAVRPSFRRAGVGSELVNVLIGKLHASTRYGLTLELRETNLVAQKFFRSMGFKATNVLKNHYVECAEDAYRMEYRLDDWCGD